MRHNKPLLELHRHLDGNVRLQTVIDLARAHNIALPSFDLETMRPHVQIMNSEPDLVAFIAKFHWLCQVMVDYSAIQRIAKENVEDAANENIDYIELRFSPCFMASAHNLDPMQVTESICEATLAGEKLYGAKTRLIVIMSRHLGVESCRQELAAAIKYKDSGVVALDLAGDEAGFPGDLFVKEFHEARDAGLGLVAHAGESDGPQSVYQAVTELGVSRIGHGVNAIKDPKVMDLLVEKQISVEMCPTSNLHTSTVMSYGEHPIKKFLDHGVLVNLNTDDPSISGINLAHEYAVAANQLGLSEADISRLQANAIQGAFDF